MLSLLTSYSSDKKPLSEAGSLSGGRRQRAFGRNLLCPESASLKGFLLLGGGIE